MRFLSTFAATAALALSAMSVNAQNTATVTISPAPGEYEELPSSFTLTIEGPTAIAKNTWTNAFRIGKPDGTGQQVAGVFSGNTITLNVPSTVDRTVKGNFEIRFQAAGAKYTWEDGSTSSSTVENFAYTVTGQGGGEEEDPDTPTPVVYDLDILKTTPNLKPLDLEMYGLETLQILFNQPNLNIDPNQAALVTITGPNYKQTAALTLNYNMQTATNFKVKFNDPVYDGDYVLTIPQGVLGDAEWLADHQYGHANAAINYAFSVTGGKDPADITVDLTFNPTPTPAPGKVAVLDEVTLAFESYPYWDAEKEIPVKIKKDQSAQAFSAFGSATVARGEGNNVVLTLTPTPTEKAEYQITLPEGMFWNEEHQNDNEAGALNGSLEFSWNLSPIVTSVNVTGHVPATNAKVAMFKAGEPGIIIMTDNNDVVASMKVEVIEYELGNDSAFPKTIVDATTENFDEDGNNICWINKTGADIELSSDCYYEVSYTLYNRQGNVIADGLFEFDGDMTTGVITIDADKNEVIYNTQGLKINKSVNELPAGLYIVNGQKIVVR